MNARSVDMQAVLKDAVGIDRLTGAANADMSLSWGGSNGGCDHEIPIGAGRDHLWAGYYSGH